ncbi:MAG: ABC transporter permease [Candidatus Bathyarchaeota archaeon]|nr:ABC transporter permease [Candidatus Bathyarchaeota archaeon]
MVSARRIVSDFKVFSRGYLRNKFGLFFGLVFPVILILIFGAIFSGDSSGSTVVYAQNQDTGPFAAPQMDIATQFVNALNGTLPDGTQASESWPIRIELVGLEKNFTQYLTDNSAADGVIIPEGFSQAYLAGEPVDVVVYGNPAASTSGIVSGTVSGVANLFNLQRFNGSAIIGVQSTTVSTEQTEYVDFLIPGLIGFSILVSPMFSLVNISSEYKKTKLFKQLSLTPLTKMEWLISKILWYIVLTIVSFLLMVSVGIFLFGAHVTLTVWLIPFLIFGPMLFASLGMLVGTVTKNPETAGIIGNIVTFPMMFLSGTFFPISMMPEYLQNIAHVLPLYYIVEGLNNVMVYGNYDGAIIDLAVVAVITVVILIAAVKLFKWRED